MEPIYNLGIRQDCIVIFMRDLFTEHHKRYYFLLKHNELTIEDVDNYNDRLEDVLTNMCENADVAEVVVNKFNEVMSEYRFGLGFLDKGGVLRDVFIRIVSELGLDSANKDGVFAREADSGMLAGSGSSLDFLCELFDLYNAMRGMPDHDYYMSDFVFDYCDKFDYSATYLKKKVKQQIVEYRVGYLAIGLYYVLNGRGIMC